MTRIEVFDPPLCCSTGVCGPSVDPRLAAFAADVDWLTAQGTTVERHNLAQEPQTFLAHPVVGDLIRREGHDCLPLVLVNGEIVGRGAYPRRDDLARLAGLQSSASTSKPKIRLTVVASGCEPGSGCC